ncbi:MAG TPA: ABC transporter permease subunit, partial [Steroidobacteraceae bacterium]|nr:ABC transporter permease subunit [Steroidobacteraceae bacterium]
RIDQEQGGLDSESWALTMLQRSRLMGLLYAGFNTVVRLTSRVPVQAPPPPITARAKSRRRGDLLFFAIVVLLVALAIWRIARMLIGETSLHEAAGVAGLALITMLRVTALIALASLIWVPAGIWVGLRPRATQIVQPVAQFLAAFPANLLFPVVVFGIVSWKLNPDIWLSPLMILGTQWYILFNVIAGASAMPVELRYAAQNFSVRGWLWWRKVALPGVLPFYVTGAITASGGSWNAAIVAELASWRGVAVKAHGLGAYIAEATTAGDFHRIILGIATMSLFVVIINRFFWRPLYYYAERKFRLT